MSRQGGSHSIAARPSWTLHIDSRREYEVRELYIEGTAPSNDVDVDVRLSGATRGSARPVHQRVRGGAPFRIRHRLDVPCPADSFDIDLRSVTGSPVQLRLRAVRVMGQSPALRQYVIDHGIPLD